MTCTCSTTDVQLLSQHSGLHLYFFRVTADCVSFFSPQIFPLLMPTYTLAVPLCTFIAIFATYLCPNRNPSLPKLVLESPICSSYSTECVHEVPPLCLAQPSASLSETDFVPSTADFVSIGEKVGVVSFC